MAVDGILNSIPGTVAGADLSLAQFHAVMLDGITPYSVVVADGTAVLGVAYTNPPNVGESVQVVHSGLVKMVASGVIAAGAPVYSNALGQASAAVLGPQIGVAMIATTTLGEIAEVLIA